MIITHNYTSSHVSVSVGEALELIRQLAASIKLAHIRNSGTASFSEGASVREVKNNQPVAEVDDCGVFTVEVVACDGRR